MNFLVTNQRIEIIDVDLTVQNTVGEYVAGFQFDDSWEGYAKTAVFKEISNEPIEVILEEDECVIPHEVFQDYGYMQVGVYGVCGTKVKPTVWTKNIKVESGVPTISTETEPTPSTYAQILEALDGLEGKQIPAGGTVGQYLQKASDDNYDLVWGNGGGGGEGGTTNYNDLSNKPQINGTTLSGNKSLSDLGIASASTVANLPTYDYVDSIDEQLQNQIDALASASDVVDVVGTKAELDAYDTSSLTENDIIKVLADSSHSNAISYYRWTGAVFTYIGSQGPFYTKSETDSEITSAVSGLASEAWVEAKNYLVASDISGKVDSANITHETWTFTLENDTTVNKEVVLWTSAD